MTSWSRTLSLDDPVTVVLACLLGVFGTLAIFLYLRGRYGPPRDLPPLDPYSHRWDEKDDDWR